MQVTCGALMSHLDDLPFFDGLVSEESVVGGGYLGKGGDVRLGFGMTGGCLAPLLLGCGGRGPLGKGGGGTPVFGIGGGTDPVLGNGGGTPVFGNGGCVPLLFGKGDCVPTLVGKGGGLL